MTPHHDESEPLVIERTFKTPVERVWKALTDADEMRHWYFDLEDFKPRVGFEFGFVVEHEGNVYDHRCKVTEAIPRQKIAYTWRYAGYEGDSQVTMELFDEGGSTRLKLTHEGFESFPKLANFGRESFTQGWTQIIGSSLKEYLEPTEPHP